VLDDTRSLWTDPDHPWVRDTWAVTAAITGRQPTPGGAPYFTDAAHLGPALGNPPCLILGPGEPDQAHQTDEWCDLERLDQAARIYLEVARRWCGA
ncbi:MAG: M20/M25/M40 family metallo-hydrolase, partial [Desulfarculus sp.]|nr:M20/M25/M40 family metallo-hydrolase [Desulfarculus sp.]